MPIKSVKRIRKLIIHFNFPQEREKERAIIIIFFFTRFSSGVYRRSYRESTFVKPSFIPRTEEHKIEVELGKLKV